MKITARLSETGRLVHAASDEDWAEVHCVGKRPALYCPEKTRGCRNKLIAVEITNRNGTVTRFFRFERKGPKCGHAEVKSGVIVHLPETQETPERIETAGESVEHKWLKRLVANIAIAAGYDAVQEHNLPGAVRADVLVEGAAQGARVEIQRGPTDIPERTQRYSDVVWLLRDAYSKSNGNSEALFSSPCVQLRIRKKCVERGRVRIVAAQPWLDTEDSDAAYCDASSTVLHLDEKGSDVPTFFSKPLDLSTFLRQVWAGERRWYPRGQAHATFAGWALDSDVDKMAAWRRGRREALQREAAAKQAAPPAVAKPLPLPAPPLIVQPQPAVPVHPSVPREGWWARMVRWLRDG